MFCVLQMFGRDEVYAEDHNTLIRHIIKEVIPKNPSHALYLTDSIAKYAKNPKQKIEALMLSGCIYKRQGKLIKDVKFAYRALEIAKRHQNHNIMAWIYGHIGQQFFTVGFFQKGEAYFEKSITLIRQPQNKSLQKSKYWIVAKAKIAKYALHKGYFHEAVEHIKPAIDVLEENELVKRTALFLVWGYQILGQSYVGLNKTGKALKAYSIAQNYIELAHAEQTLYAGLVYEGLGCLFIKTGHLNRAETYLQKALAIAKGANHSLFEKRVYESLELYYRYKNELDKSMLYDAKSDSLSEKLNHTHKEMINEMDALIEKYADQDTVYSVWALGFGGLVLMAGGFYVFVYKKNSINFSAISTKHKKKKEEASTSLKLSSEMVTKLKQRLALFEESKKYLDKEMSFSSFVSEMETNTKYLNHFLKYTLKKDYHTYICDLRIQYIVDKLKNDKSYRNYKLSYLAEECGFSSYSAFAANFKRLMVCPPSKFIKKLA